MSIATLGGAALVVGCNGNIGGPGQTPSGGGPTGSGGTGSGGTGTGGGSPLVCSKSALPARAPIRRLTHFEYNNTVRDLLGDTTNPGDQLPAEEQSNGFGNDADRISVPDSLAPKYESLAEDIAGRATGTPAQLAKLDPCGMSVTAATEESCATKMITYLLPRAYRRQPESGEIDAHLALFKTVRLKNTFASSVAAVIEAMLQSPDFLYRPEIGAPDPKTPTLIRPTGAEMATRLSYFLWGTMPDDTLRLAASNGDLNTPAGVLAQAKRLLDDQRSHVVVQYFFDSLLPINALPYLTRDKTRYPTFTGSIGALMHTETQRFLEHAIYELGSDWPSILTAPYTFVNGPLAAYYGMSGVTGDTFQKVMVDGTKRSGLLTHPGVLAGLIPADNDNPVARGGFIVKKMMCKNIPLPTGDILAMVKAPDPYSGNTARERFTAHSKQAVCAACHHNMDPVGYALENFDPVGLWRDTENGEMIDPTGTFPDNGMPITGPVALAKLVAASDTTQACFAQHWTEFAYGLTLGPDDACTQSAVNDAFKKSNYNVKQLLLDLTQTNAFLYLPAAR